MPDYRLQISYQRRYGSSATNYLAYRWGRDNGWHCGHWHWSVDEATRCLRIPPPVVVEEPPPPGISAYTREALA